MNHYDFYPGDYLKDTLGLSMLEDGAYRRLLDHYYSTEQPIQDAEKYRVARATGKAEREAVERVLGRFFNAITNQNEHTHWVHGKVEREIEKAMPKVAAARKNGRKGGRPKGNPRGSSLENRNQTQATTQSGTEAEPNRNPVRKLPPPSPPPPPESDLKTAEPAAKDPPESPGSLASRIREPERTPGTKPEPRQDPLFERFPFAKWFPSAQILAWATEIGLSPPDFDAALSDVRNKFTQHRDVTWWDRRVLGFLGAAAKRSPGESAGPSVAPAETSEARERRRQIQAERDAEHRRKLREEAANTELPRSLRELLEGVG